MGANPSSSDLLFGVVASPENAGVERKGHDGGDVGCLDGALCGVLAMVSADVRMVEGVAGGLDIHCEGVCGLLLLPVVNERVNCINESVLWDRVEKADQVIVGGVQGDVYWGLGEVAVKMAPKLGNGHLAGMLGVKVLKDNVKGTAGDAK